MYAGTHMQSDVVRVAAQQGEVREGDKSFWVNEENIIHKVKTLFWNSTRKKEKKKKKKKEKKKRAWKR